MSLEKIGRFFVDASTLNRRGADKYSPEEWERRQEESGVKHFKRRVLGFCGSKTIKTVDEVADVLYDIGIVQTIKDGRALIPNICNKLLAYGEKALYLERVGNPNGQMDVRISSINFPGERS